MTSCDLLRLSFAQISLLVTYWLASPAVAGDAADGLWLLPRKDPQNTARAGVPGEMTSAPREVWKFGGEALTYSALFPVTVGGGDAYLGQAHSGLRLVRPDSTVLWSRPKLGVSSVIAVEDFDGNGSFEALVTRGPSEVALVEATSGEVRWSWIAPAGASVGSFKIWRHGNAVRFICFPQNALSGVCIDLPALGDCRRYRDGSFVLSR